MTNHSLIRCLIVFLVVVSGSVVINHKAAALFLDGGGYYSLRGETLSNPGFSPSRGTYQATKQNFHLLGEARANDRLSFFLGIRLFEDSRGSYLGDTPKSREDECWSSDTQEDYSCHHQSTADPRYEPYTPKVTEAYVRYAFDYCLLDVGRRGRDWGIGIFQSSGKKPFDTDASIYDGVTCNVNIQKAQALGFSVGWDKLAESGVPTIPNSTDSKDDPRTSSRYGANNRADDVEQYFFTIEYDDRKVNAGASFTKQIGIYFANMVSSGSKTDLKYFDLFTGFYLYDLAFRNEFLFRINKSGDPAWYAYGASRRTSDDDPATKLDSIGFAGDLSYTVSKQGSAIGPSEYREGSLESHIVFMEYAYAPGDADGYITKEVEEARNPSETYGRDNKVSAMAFHRNYKPAMIFFNGNREIDDMRVDGVYDPSKFMDAMLFSLGYRYESFSIGNIEAKLITARLLQRMPSYVKSYYEDQAQLETRQRDGTLRPGNPATGEKADIPLSPEEYGKRPVGYWGKQSLGYELDINYRFFWGRELEFGFGTAAALPEKTWQTREGESPAFSLLLRGDVAFKF